MSVTAAHASCPCCRTFDDPVTDRPIAGSVGLGGANRSADVLAIQQLLNALTPVEGGPSPMLVEDGLMGPKTRAAITNYQNSALGWSDGRIDVNGPTIKALTRQVVDSPTVPYGKLGAPAAGSSPGATPTPTDPAIVAAVAGAAAVLQARQCIVALEPRLHTLRLRLTRATPGSPMMGFLNKHFASGLNKVTPDDLGRIQTVLSDIHVFLARFNALGKLPVANVILYDPEPNDSEIAYTVRGGDKLSTEQAQIYKDKGKLKKFPGQSIWLTELFDKQPSFEKHWVVLHEFCHFVGGRDGTASRVDDHAYAFDPKFVGLTKFQKLHNAESLALCFLEWCLGSHKVLDLPRLSLAREHFAQFPRVATDGDFITL